MNLHFKINVPSWLQRIIVWPFLLYHRLCLGHSVHLIYIAKFKFAVVDPANYDELRRYKWRLCRSSRTFYAFRNVSRGPLLRQKIVWMHHLVLPPPLGLIVDHANHNGLDNRRFNLRLATNSTNQQNARKSITKTTSRFKGVDRIKATGRWRARIVVAGKRLFLGSFTDELPAAKAYDRAALRFFGEFACINFAREDYNVEIRYTNDARRKAGFPS
jgi:hypothetical protein